METILKVLHNKKYVPYINIYMIIFKQWLIDVRK